ncbi:DUF6093 family protein [Rothia koreensis]|uniref:DUF6093 family protein n=1 Tax=Rothia koreensis TaxID=592378 RepID=UPI0037C80072
MPLVNGKVFHPQWSTHHQPTAAGTMTGVCRVWDRSAGPPIGLDGPGPNVLQAHGVPCRVQELHSLGDSTGQAAGQEITQRRYLVTVPIDTPVWFKAGARGHQIEITRVTQGGDPMLKGRRFDVAQVLTGSEAWERDLICVDNQTQNEAGADEG